MVTYQRAILLMVTYQEAIDVDNCNNIMFLIVIWMVCTRAHMQNPEVFVIMLNIIKYIFVYFLLLYCDDYL